MEFSLDLFQAAENSEKPYSILFAVPFKKKCLKYSGLIEKKEVTIKLAAMNMREVENLSSILGENDTEMDGLKWNFDTIRSNREAGSILRMEANSLGKTYTKRNPETTKEINDFDTLPKVLYDGYGGASFWGVTDDDSDSVIPMN